MKPEYVEIGKTYEFHPDPAEQPPMLDHGDLVTVIKDMGVSFRGKREYKVLVEMYVFETELEEI